MLILHCLNFILGFFPVFPLKNFCGLFPLKNFCAMMMIYSSIENVLFSVTCCIPFLHIVICTILPCTLLSNSVRKLSICISFVFILPSRALVVVLLISKSFASETSVVFFSSTACCYSVCRFYNFIK